MEQDPEINKLESRMKKAWRDRPSSKIPEKWQEGVMDAVHGLADKPSPLPNIVLKRALLAASAAVLFLILIPKEMLSSDNSLVQLIMQDPAGFLSNLPLDF